MAVGKVYPHPSTHVSKGATRGTNAYRKVPAAKYYKKDYWQESNLAFTKPHFRLEKCAQIINTRAKNRECRLLDIGCGPATLTELLHSNIHYYGIDIAIHRNGNNFIESDIVQNTIDFNGMHFDFVVASGLFEYLGDFQCRKFAEINKILNDDGEFILTYSNIKHRRFRPEQPWNNVQTISEFGRDLADYFLVKRFFASSHNRFFYAPQNPWMKKIQMKINTYLPILSPWLAVEYFFICSRKQELME